MAHIDAALTSIINKNSCEAAIKVFLDLQVQHGRAVTKQADGFKEALGDIIPETFSIKNPNMCSFGKTEDIVVKAAQFRDLLAIFIILARLPKDVNASYQGQIRELLTPFLEDISEFSMKTFVKKLEDYEDKKTSLRTKRRPELKQTLEKGENHTQWVALLTNLGVMTRVLNPILTQQPSRTCRTL